MEAAAELAQKEAAAELAQKDAAAAREELEAAVAELAQREAAAELAQKEAAAELAQKDAAAAREELEAAVAELAQREAAAAKKEDELEAAVAELAQDLTQKEAAAARKEEELRLLVGSLAEKDRIISDLLQKTRDKDDEAARQAAESDRSVKALTDTNAQLESSMAYAEKRIDTLEKQVTSSQTACDKEASERLRCETEAHEELTKHLDAVSSMHSRVTAAAARQAEATHKIADITRENQELKEAAAATKRAHVTRVHELTQASDDREASLNESSRQALEAKTKQYTKEMGSIKSAMNELKTTFEEQTSAYEASLDGIYNDETSKNKANMNNLREDHKREIEVLKATHTVELDKMYDTFRAELTGEAGVSGGRRMATLARQVRQLMADVDNKEDEFDTQRRKDESLHQEQIYELHQQIHKLKTELSKAAAEKATQKQVDQLSELLQDTL